ncbi:phosphatidylglycerophosphatase A family protein [Flavitalea flava]
MGRFHQLFSSCLGIGYAKGGGTYAAIVTCIGWYFAFNGREPYAYGPVLATILIFFTGVWSSTKMESKWGKDSSKIVIDEVAGMALTLLFIPVRWPYILSGLVLFRFFDIVKPLYIRKMEKLKGGWGVMMDDMLAGLYANLILQIIVVAKLW